MTNIIGYRICFTIMFIFLSKTLTLSEQKIIFFITKILPSISSLALTHGKCVMSKVI